MAYLIDLAIELKDIRNQRDAGNISADECEQLEDNARRKCRETIQRSEQEQDADIHKQLQHYTTTNQNRPAKYGTISAQTAKQAFAATLPTFTILSAVNRAAGGFLIIASSKHQINKAFVVEARGNKIFIDCVNA